MTLWTALLDLQLGLFTHKPKWLIFSVSFLVFHYCRYLRTQVGFILRTPPGSWLPWSLYELSPQKSLIGEKLLPLVFFLDTEPRGQASQGQEGDSLSSGLSAGSICFPWSEAPHCAQNSRSPVLMHGQEQTLHASRTLPRFLISLIRLCLSTVSFTKA